MDKAAQYVLHGGSELDRAQAECEYTASHLGRALDELEALRKENEVLSASITKQQNYIDFLKPEVMHLRLVIEKMAEADEDGSSSDIQMMAKIALSRATQ